MNWYRRSSYGSTYGAWISPNGEVHNGKGSESHADIADNIILSNIGLFFNILKDKIDEINKELTIGLQLSELDERSIGFLDTNKILFGEGWLRLVYGRELSASTESMTLMQKKVLEELSINKNIIIDESNSLLSFTDLDKAYEYFNGRININYESPFRNFR